MQTKKRGSWRFVWWGDGYGRLYLGDPNLLDHPEFEKKPGRSPEGWKSCMRGTIG